MHLKSILLAQLGLTAYVSADCCNPSKYSRGIGYTLIPLGPAGCADNSKGTPCCGNGKCNIFCCNCDGGCRGSSNSKEKRDDTSAAAGAADSLFQRVDTDNDNEITLAEYIGWVTRNEGAEVANNATLMTMWIEKFEAHDANGDGKIEPNEMERPDQLS